MQAELASRPQLAPDSIGDIAPPTAASTPETTPSTADQYLSPEEQEWGRQIYDYVSQYSTGQNRTPFIVGKFVDDTVPGLVRGEREYQSLVYNGDGTYHSSDPETLFSAAVAQNLDSHDEPETNYLTTYPSPTQTGQTVYNYTSWQTVRSLAANSHLSPADIALSFVFEGPSQDHAKFMTTVQKNPRVLEALLAASPYGRLLQSVNPKGPVERNKASQLRIIPVGDVSSLTKTDASHSARQVLNQARNRPTAPIHPPVGDFDKQSYRR